ncbi:hypothetical protein [Microbacterium gilvum]|uniref:hypothetical protein n=1 Tax=Microbacterium gilvum TaxID=1336204 RepID=UPI0031F0548D
MGFLGGLILTVSRSLVLPEQFGRDANRIYLIASGQADFADGSYTPVAIVYRLLGLGAAPDVAAVLGYVLASVAIIVGIARSGRRTAGVLTAVYISSAFLLAGVYLGQYSKDVFVIPLVLLLLLLPKRIWWEITAVAGMLVYAYFFRDYWAIVAVAYVGFRVVTIWQVRLRYLLVSGALCAVIVGLAFFIVLGHDPNHFRTAVQDHLDANTIIMPIELVNQPIGGLVDIFVNYWLLYVPLMLPFTAGIPYVVILIGYVFVKVLPLVSLRSAIRWPSGATLDGVLVRRSLALMLAFGVVQAVFEPDYGSALRHFTPLMPLAIVVMQSMRSGTPRVGKALPWSWGGGSVEGVDQDASATER